MSTVQEIERAIERLRPQEMDELFAWMEEHYAQSVDARIKGRPGRWTHGLSQPESAGRERSCLICAKVARLKKALQSLRLRLHSGLPPQRAKAARRGPRYALGWYVVAPLALGVGAGLGVSVSVGGEPRA
jgi:hypothetical protein